MEKRFVSMSSEIYEKFHREIKKRKLKHLFRELKIGEGVDFCSNDYLGLSKDRSIQESLKMGVDLYGAGSTASRLVRGHRDVMEKLEDAFSEWVVCEDSLFVANGYTANLGLLSAIADPQTYIFTDRLNHASILDGIRISGAKKVYFNHLDMDHLERQLLKHGNQPYTKRIIVSETIFSMDGDISPISSLVELKTKYNSMLIMDETHALGVFGDQGAGLCRDSKRIASDHLKDIDFRIFTLGKALGLEGGVISCQAKVAKNYLINCMRNFVFSTAPMPAIAYSGLFAIEKVKKMDRDREHVFNLSKSFRDRLRRKGFQLGRSESQIVPILYPTEEEALSVSEMLQKNGMDVRAIRPPTVPTPRLRISIHADHSLEDVSRLADRLENSFS